MRELDLLIRGIIVGLMIAMPVGPVNILCIHRALEAGWKSGVISGLGAAAADMLYGAVAGFSITLVVKFVVREQSWIRFFGGILLVVIGVSLFYGQFGAALAIVLGFGLALAILAAFSRGL